MKRVWWPKEPVSMNKIVCYVVAITLLSPMIIIVASTSSTGAATNTGSIFNDTGYHILQYIINATIQPNIHQLMGDVSVTIMLDANTTSIPFFLFPEFNVSDIQDEYGSHVAWNRGYNTEWEQQETILNVILNQTVIPSTIRLKIFYCGIVGENNTEIYNYIGPEGTYLRNYLYDTIPSNGSWFPLNSFAPMEYHINVPAGLVLLAQGSLTKASNNATMITYSWEISRFEDATGNIVIIDDYKVVTRSQDNINITFYYIYELPHNANKSASEAMDIFNFYVNHFGAIPLSNLRIVETGPTSPPGEGFFSFITIQGIKELSEKELKDTLAHEIAHQWWGNQVKFEGPGETWFPEGLATYSSNLYYSTIKNDSFIIELALENCVGLPIGDFGKEIPLSNISIYSDIGDNEDPRLGQILIYQKSAVVFHMLRYIIGNENFDSLLHKLVGSYKDSNCTLSDFINESEKISNIDLKWFFDEWVFSTDNLDYYIEGVESNKKDGHYENHIHLGKKGTASMPVEIEIETASGDKLLLTGIWINNSRTITVNTNSSINIVRIDPGNWIFDTNPNNNNWKYSNPIIWTPIVISIVLLVVIATVIMIFIRRKDKK